MAENAHEYTKGDWVVHLHHGVGEIKSIEEKMLGGESSIYYKVKTSKSTLWVPLEKGDNKWFRPLASRQELGEVFEVLQRPAQEMHSNHNKRKARIKSVRANDSLLDMARLIRDLWARRVKDGLNNTEEQALRKFTDRLVREWSVCMGLTEEEARRRMQTMLHESQTQPA